MDITNRQSARERQPMDIETAIAVVLLAIALLIFGSFGLTYLNGMFSLASH